MVPLSPRDTGQEASIPARLIPAAVLAVLLSVSAQAQPAGTETALAPGAAMQALDADKDGSLSFDEVRKGAEAKFDALDTDHDSTLDAKELTGTLRARQVARADPDKDKTLDRKEYLAVVERRFKAADSDHDGKLEEKELRSANGQAVLRMLRY